MLKQERASLLSTRVESEERTAVLREIANLAHQEQDVSAKLAQFAECDPDELRKIQDATQVARDSANRWTDNLFTLKRWIETRFGLPSSTFYEQFDIPDDLDYLEDDIPTL
mmetsp:Transcript_17438/g.36207  ORF Transcript_17438/g.36207 Transcript_17438/m.36207 type:complete len:111 (+) Transcript_17438:444-776(+)